MKADINTPIIYWLGGSTCAGKTTISNILSEKYGFIVYHCDEYLAKHIEKSNAQDHPNLNQVSKISWNDILSMKVEEYLKWTIGLFKEEFKMILEDLYKFSDGSPILVEGVGLLPELINNEISDINHAIWIVADELFYKRHQMERVELFKRIKECSNPDQALENYINYDLAMGRYIMNDAKRLGLSAIQIVDDCEIMKKVETISSYFKLV